MQGTFHLHEVCWCRGLLSQPVAMMHCSTSWLQVKVSYSISCITCHRTAIGRGAPSLPSAASGAPPGAFMHSSISCEAAASQLSLSALSLPCFCAGGRSSGHSPYITQNAQPVCLQPPINALARPHAVLWAHPAACQTYLRLHFLTSYILHVRLTHLPLPHPICRYVVPPQQAEVFEAAVAARCGDHALARLTGKGIFELFSAADLAALGVKRFVQMPGTGVMTFPVSLPGSQACACALDGGVATTARLALAGG